MQYHPTMAHSFQITLLSFLFMFSITQAQPSFRPTALVVPVKKDASTLQYVTTVNQRTPQVPTNLVIDLGGRFLWVGCDKNYVSSTYRPVRCRTSQCSLAGSNSCGDCFDGPRPGCNNNTCGVFPEISIYKAGTEAFIKESATRNITRVASVTPFWVCFSTNNVGSTRVGPSVPYFKLVLQSQSVVWTITGSNSMVYVNDNVLCLGVVEEDRILELLLLSEVSVGGQSATI